MPDKPTPWDEMDPAKLGDALGRTPKGKLTLPISFAAPLAIQAAFVQGGINEQQKGEAEKILRDQGAQAALDYLARFLPS